jgi:hypothetical protein
LRKELGSYDFPVIEPFGFDFDDWLINNYIFII